MPMQLSWTADDVASLERATFDAVPPRRLVELRGWLVGIDEGTVGRARSAVPLAHASPRPGVIDAIEQCCAQAQSGPMLRVPALSAFDDLRAELARRGYVSVKPTLVMVAPLAGGTSALPGGAHVALSHAADDAWASVFLGEGFDPVDGASRTTILRRSTACVFATVRDDGGAPIAVGAASLSQGWCGIHGMRTAAAWRGRGLAGSIVAALAQEAMKRGTQRAFLQVESGNAAAQSLYRRAGFGEAWAYLYWKQQAA